MLDQTLHSNRNCSLPRPVSALFQSNFTSFFRIRSWNCSINVSALLQHTVYCSHLPAAAPMFTKMLDHLLDFECLYIMHQPHGPSSMLPRVAAPVRSPQCVVKAPLLSTWFCCSISSTTVTPQHAPQNSCPSSSPLMKWSSSASGMREPMRTAREKASSSLLSSQMPSACGTILGPRAQLRVQDSSRATERLTLPQVHSHHHCFCFHVQQTCCSNPHTGLAVIQQMWTGFAVVPAMFSLTLVSNTILVATITNIVPCLNTVILICSVSCRLGHAGFPAPAPRQPVPAGAAAAAAYAQGMPPGRHPNMASAQNPRGQLPNPRGPAPGGQFQPPPFAAAGQAQMAAAGPMAYNAQGYPAGYDRGGRGGAGAYTHQGHYPPGGVASGGYGAYGTAGGHQATGGRGPNPRPPPSNAAYPSRDQPAWTQQRR